MEFNGYKCDVCGREKGPANHWYRYFVGACGFEIRPWGDGPHDDEGHLCGMECAVKAMTKALQAGA